MEKEAGTQPGYMSRLEKEGNTSATSIEFLVTAVNIFDVNIDTLINGSIGDVSLTEKLLMRFFQNMIADTREDSINWQCDTPDFLSICRYAIHSDGSTTDHPLIKSTTGVRH